MTWRLIGLKDDKTSRKGKVVAFCPCRLKREDCPPKKTYDFAFSQWEVSSLSSCPSLSLSRIQHLESCEEIRPMIKSSLICLIRAFFNEL